MGDNSTPPDALFDFVPANAANDEDAATLAQLRATSEGLKRLNDMLRLFEETEAETRTSKTSASKTG